MKNLLVVILLILNYMNVARALNHEFHSDWTPHRTCTVDTRFFQNYCLEIMELSPKARTKPKNVILLVSGLFQNANGWDLLPEKGISLARYLRDKYDAQIFVLHPRGIGGSDYIKQTNLDDLAIDDLSTAVNFVINRTLQKPIIIGHSQGSIITQAYASGLSRCGAEKNCFIKGVAKIRKLLVRSIGLIAGNPTLTTDGRNNFLIPLTALGRLPSIQLILKTWDLISVETLTHYTSAAAFFDIWSNLYVLNNVSSEARIAIWQKTVDATTGAILIQFAEAVKNKDLMTRGGVSYKSGLKNISSPLFQMAMENDKLAPPVSTKTAFNHIGSVNKEFEVIANRGHLDLSMNAKLHSDVDNMLNFLIKY